MKQTILAGLIMMSGLAGASDLTIPGERWLAKGEGYRCAAYGTDVVAPTSHSDMNVTFEQITTDRTLDNGLLKASFTENGVECRYSAILLADNAAGTIGLVESKAYSVDGTVDCETGKEVLDNQLEFNDYLYWGHPHRLTIMIPDASAEGVCGVGATHIGINFVVAGFIGQN
jgi:hypothetical protein